MLLDGAEADLATASLAGRELPGDLVQQVSDLTMGQLFYILSHIQKLSAQAPVTAQALLAENPQICHALLHAECLAGMMEEPLLPMTGEELKKAKSMARQMQEDLADHELPQPAAGAAAAQGRPMPVVPNGMLPVGAPVSKFAARPPFPLLVGPPVYAKSQAARLPRPTAAPFGVGAPVPAPPSFAGPLASSLGLGNLSNEEEKQSLLHKAMQLTPEQISRLPEETKFQLLTFLQQQSQQG